MSFEGRHPLHPRGNAERGGSERDLDTHTSTMMTMSFGDDAPWIYLYKRHKKMGFNLFAIIFENCNKERNQSHNELSRDTVQQPRLSPLKLQNTEKAYVLRRVNKLCYILQCWLRLLSADFNRDTPLYRITMPPLNNYRISQSNC